MLGGMRVAGVLSDGAHVQGLFLKRQQQVSGEFSDYLTRNVLTSEALWNNMLFGSKSQEFLAVLQVPPQPCKGGCSSRGVGEVAMMVIMGFTMAAYRVRVPLMLARVLHSLGLDYMIRGMSGT